MDAPKLLGETTITGRNQINLPAKGLRELGWARGDRLLVEAIDENTIALIRRPGSFTDHYAGRFGHVFGTHEQNLRYLAELRRDWDE